MKPQNLPRDALQRLRFTYRRVEDLVKLFEGDEEEVVREIKRRTKPPVSYLKHQTNKYLVRGLIKYGYPGMAKRYGVSVSFLRKLVTERTTLDVDLLVDRNFDDLTDILPFNSVRIALGIPPDKALLDSESPLEVTKGRAGELIYKQYRGSLIVEDMFETDPRNKDYDFIDEEYGRVNVKSSKVYFYAGGDPYYKYSVTINLDAVDFFALILSRYDDAPRTFEEVDAIFMLPASKVSPSTSTIILRNVEDFIEKNEVDILYINKEVVEIEQPDESVSD
jgi:hypothetical protein